MLQACKKQSNKPYYIQAIETNVYSLEEINYFIYNHMNMVYRDFFCESLYAYMEEELELKEMAAKLRRLDENGATVRDFILCILKDSNYYSANDLAKVSELVMNINNLSREERMLLEADSMLKQKRYGSALHIYLDILNGRDADDPSKQQLYAKIAFSVGMIYARMFMGRSANTYFSMAYDLYADPVYAKASVYMSIINNDDEELLKSIIRYKVSDEALAAIRKQIDKSRASIERSEGFLQFEDSLNEEGQAEKQIAKWKKEYYTMLS